MTILTVRPHQIGPTCWCHRTAERVGRGVKIVHGDTLGRALNLHPTLMADGAIGERTWGTYEDGVVVHVIHDREMSHG